MTPGEDVASGYAALSRGAWTEAQADFERALAVAESAEAYEGLGVAAWWLDDVTTTFDARRRAFRLYRSCADRRGAGRVATAVAWDYLLAGDRAICSGWLQRARRLLDDLDLCAESGWLTIFDAHLALIVGPDAAAAEAASVKAAALGRDLGGVDLEMLGLAYQGLALVSQGSVSGGMRLLDEATAAALAGEIQDPDAAASYCCALIYACERECDYPRAAEWCNRLKEMSARWSYRLMLSVCRSHYAGILLWRGEWSEAEVELLSALQAQEASRPSEAAESVVRLAVCGSGWSTIALARGYPAARVHGIDLDGPSIESAHRNAVRAGVTDRVTCTRRDAADPAPAGRYDLVTLFETLHDMAHPVEVRRAAKAMLAPGGAVLIGDERVAESFTAPGDDLDRFNYGWSALHCLAAALVEPDAAGTGT